MYFRGVSTVNVDAKGRLAVPAKFRERIPPLSEEPDAVTQVVVTIDIFSPKGERCLLAYPEPTWLDVERRMMALPPGDRVVKRIQRLFLGHASEIPIDGQGRILLPASLREFGNIGTKEKALVVGQGEKFEIWNEAQWRKVNGEWLDEGDDLLAGLSDELRSELRF